MVEQANIPWYQPWSIIIGGVLILALLLTVLIGLAIRPAEPFLPLAENPVLKPALPPAKVETPKPAAALELKKAPPEAENPPRPEPKKLRDDPLTETVDDVTVKITVAKIARVKLDDFRSEFTSLDEHLIVELWVTNNSEVKKLLHVGWAGDTFGRSTDAGLTDNFGNVHRRQGFGFTSKVRGQIKGASIYPGKSRTDVLVFDLPVEKMESLHLKLPASAFGGVGTFQFEIPKSMVKQVP